VNDEPSVDKSKEISAEAEFLVVKTVDLDAEEESVV
jgi:hypothetical protein